ncbi:hypothetical protein BDW62DRAFT_142812 [Aspergillus aurantiobrunneus]
MEIDDACRPGFPAFSKRNAFYDFPLLGATATASTVSYNIEFYFHFASFGILKGVFVLSPLVSSFVHVLLLFSSQIHTSFSDLRLCLLFGFKWVIPGAVRGLRDRSRLLRNQGLMYSFFIIFLLVFFFLYEKTAGRPRRVLVSSHYVYETVVHEVMTHG